MKPRKKYIQQEVIKEIEADIKKTEEDLKKHWIALRNAILGNFKIKTTDFKKTDWSVDIELPCEAVGIGREYDTHLFIDKKTGKNRYPKS